MFYELYRIEFLNYIVVLIELKILRYIKKFFRKKINECLNMWELICGIIKYYDYVYIM